MRRRLRLGPGGAALIGLFAAFPAAAEDEDHVIDDVFAERAACMLARSLPGASGSPSPCMTGTDADCSSAGEDASQACFIGVRAREFCGNPAAFCTAVTPAPPAGQTGPTGPFTGALTDAQRNRTFVSPRCEAGTLGFQPGGVHGDRHYAQWVRSAWGCGSPAFAVSASEGSAAFSRRYECEASKIPFDCRTGRVRAAAHELYTSGSSRQSERGAYRSADIAAGSFFQLHGGRIRPGSDGSCVVTIAENVAVRVGDDLGNSGPGGRLPPPVEGETFDAYRARLANDGLRGRVDLRTGSIDENDVRSFASTSDLIGHGSTRFRFAARTAFTPERVRMARDIFAAARGGMERYLRSISAPAAVIQRVRRLDLVNFDHVTNPHSPPTREERATMSQLEADCRRHDDAAIGYSNAFHTNHAGHSHAGGLVSVCPRELLESSLTSPSRLLRIFAHEVGHSIDTCNLADTQTAIPNDGAAASACTAPPAPAIPDGERPDVNAFFQRVQTLASCMTGATDSSGAPVIRDNRMEAHARWVRAARRCAGGNADCVGDAFSSTGPRRHCGANFETIRRSRTSGVAASRRHHCEDANAALDEVRAGYGNEGPQDQTQEASADFWGSQALVLALQDPALNPAPGTAAPPFAVNWSQQGVSERRAEVLTSLAAQCHEDLCLSPQASQCPGGAADWDNDSHPDRLTRISIWASSASIREAMGCQPRDGASVPGGALPLAGCVNAFNGAPAATASAP